MNCPHYRDAPHGLMECSLAAAKGVHAIAGPGMANFPCNRCKAAWVDGQPPKEGEWPPGLPVWLLGDHPPLRGDDRPITSPHRSPRDCQHYVADDDYCGPCKSRKYRCQLHGVVPWSTCQTCHDWRPDAEEDG